MLSEGALSRDRIALQCLAGYCRRMPGMNRTLQTGNPYIISAFKSMLFHQLLVVLVIGALLAVVWNILRSVQYKRAVAVGGRTLPSAAKSTATNKSSPEPVARRMLRVTFGLLWIFDGVLQAQGSMPLGLPSGVLKPGASSSPAWVQHVVHIGIAIWTNHPVEAASSVVWIQVGIGLLLLVAPRGRWSRTGGIVSITWGLVVWIFGEAFGGIFGSGLSWAFGAPGAAFFYIAAGVLIALPERSWQQKSMGRGILAAMGGLFVAMSILQAWPGRGFWQGQVHGSSTVGTMPEMIREMAHVPQPGFLASWVSSFANFDASHGWGLNLVLVMGLAVIGTGLLSGKSRVTKAMVLASTALCLADWILVQDLGFMGGIGTDPNSMIPMAMMLIAGYVAMVHLPVQSRVETTPPVNLPRTRWERLDPTYAFRASAAIAAIAIVLLGAVPMLAASTDAGAELRSKGHGTEITTSPKSAPITPTTDRRRQQAT